MAFIYENTVSKDWNENYDGTVKEISRQRFLTDFQQGIQISKTQVVELHNWGLYGCIIFFILILFWKRSFNTLFISQWTYGCDFVRLKCWKHEKQITKCFPPKEVVFSVVFFFFSQTLSFFCCWSPFFIQTCNISPCTWLSFLAICIFYVYMWVFLVLVVRFMSKINFFIESYGCCAQMFAQRKTLWNWIASCIEHRQSRCCDIGCCTSQCEKEMRYEMLIDHIKWRARRLLFHFLALSLSLSFLHVFSICVIHLMVFSAVFSVLRWNDIWTTTKRSIHKCRKK